MRSQLRPLEKDNAETVAQHLVAAGRLLDVDPETAYQHAKAALNRAGRIGAVREAMGLVAYQLENYEEAVRELRTHRRITGSDDNLAVLADAERGRGRSAKALEIFSEADKSKLAPELYSELVIVAAGAHTDLGDVKSARALLEQQSFTGNASGATVRLLSAYADLLRLDGDGQTADKYEELARRAAKATNTLFGDEEPDPNAGVEIITLEEVPEPVDEQQPSAEQISAADEAKTEDRSDPAAAAKAKTEDRSDRVAAAEPAGEYEPEAAPRSFQAEVEAEVDEILAEAGIGEETAEAPTPEEPAADKSADEETAEGPAPDGPAHEEPAPEKPESEKSPEKKSEQKPTATKPADEEEPPEEEEMTAPLFDL